MNSFDTCILHFLNRFAQRSWVFDHAIALLSENALFKGVLAMTIFWFLWFRHENTRNEEERRFLLFGLLSSCIGLVLARTLAHLLPFRERPLHNPSLHIQVPFGFDPASFIDWSSFPSDHATLYFSLAVTFLFVSRRLGIAALAYTLLVICLPRIYSGVHYPTDILGGALLGTAMACLGRGRKLRNRVTNPFWQWLQKSRGSFYAFFFFCSYSLAQHFEDFRNLGSAARKLATLISHTIWLHVGITGG